MSSKLIFLLLTALLLVQCSVGKPMPDGDTAVEVSKEEETKKQCNETSVDMALKSFLSEEASEFVDLLLVSVKDFGDDLVAEVDDWEEISENLKNKIDKFTEYRNKLANIELKDMSTLRARVGLLEETGDLLDTFNITDNEHPNHEDSVIEATFNRFEEELAVRFLKFTERFCVAADKFLDSLCPDHQHQLESFAEWLINFKNETSFGKKYDLFFAIYGV